MQPTQRSADPSSQRRKDNLAQVFQEVLTVTERLRSGRQNTPDANAFRNQIREALRAADVEGRKRGYSAEEIQLCTFAAVAFLDESILNLRQPVFADWPRQPLQEELFGHHIAGEVFFQNTQKMLGQNDSQVLADVLEVYYLCLLLGFAGRYSVGGKGELRATIDQIAQKIARIRGHAPEISPAWQIPPGAPPKAVSAGDPHLMKFLIAAIVCVVLTAAAFFGYKVALGSGISDIQSIAASSRG